MTKQKTEISSKKMLEKYGIKQKVKIKGSGSTHANVWGLINSDKKWLIGNLNLSSWMKLRKLE